MSDKRLDLLEQIASANAQLILNIEMKLKEKPLWSQQMPFILKAVVETLKVINKNIDEMLDNSPREGGA